MARTDIFLKIDGIDGESEDGKHKDWIDVLSWSFGATQQGSASYGGGMGTGKVNMGDFHFTMKMNKASPNLFLACCNGKVLKAHLKARKPTGTGGQDPFLEVKFTDIIISSYQTGGSEGGDNVPTESISFNFSKVEMGYKFQDTKSGALRQGPQIAYDVKKNEGA
jgi:type VI secretion system secreted protein Hcp